MDEFIGIIKIFGGNFAPQGWAMCQGQLLSISQNQALFSILGTIYGGDGITNFALPDLRGRIALGMGNGPGLSPYTQGQKAGNENTSLNLGNLPSHNHTLLQTAIAGQANIRISDNVANAPNGKNNALAQVTNLLPGSTSDRPQIYESSPGFTENNMLNASSVDTSQLNLPATPTTPVGNNIPFSNLQPYIAVNFIICLQGIYPPRN